MDGVVLVQSTPHSGQAALCQDSWDNERKGQQGFFCTTRFPPATFSKERRSTRGFRTQGLVCCLLHC